MHMSMEYLLPADRADIPSYIITIRAEFFINSLFCGPQ